MNPKLGRVLGAGQGREANCADLGKLWTHFPSLCKERQRGEV